MVKRVKNWLADTPAKTFPRIWICSGCHGKITGGMLEACIDYKGDGPYHIKCMPLSTTGQRYAQGNDQ